MSPGLLLQVVVAGLAAGSVYALIGLGYSLVFRMSGVLNFAQGDLVSLGGFGLLLFAGTAAAATVPAGALAAAGLAALALSVGACLLLARIAVAPYLRLGSTTGWIAGTAAAGLLIRSLIGLRFPAEGYTVPDLLPVAGWGDAGVLRLAGGGVLQLRDVAVLAVALGLAVAFDRGLASTRTGKAMQAAAQAPEAARLVGISPERLRLVAWALAGLLAAAAGLLVAPGRPFSLHLGVVLGLKGIAAAVLGRLGSARGAVAAGLGLGVLESVLTNLGLPGLGWGGLRLPALGPFPDLHDLVALTLLVLALALAPRWLGVEATPLD